MNYKPIISKANNGDFQPAPAGAHGARCIDIVARGVQQSSFGKAQDKIEVYWVISENMEDGRPFIVMQKYTNSLHEMSTLYQHLSSWRGRPFTAAEQAGFQIENIIGHACYISIVHNENAGRIYANVQTIMPLPKGMAAPEIPEGFIRQVERNPSRDVRSIYYSEQGREPVAAKNEPKNEPAMADAFTDDELPF